MRAEQLALSVLVRRQIKSLTSKIESYKLLEQELFNSCDPSKPETEGYYKKLNRVRNRLRSLRDKRAYYEGLQRTVKSKEFRWALWSADYHKGN